MLAPQKESIFGCSCRLWLLSWRRARVFARSCSLLSKYLPISWKQRKEQSHAQCHVTHRIRIFDKITEHIKVAKSVDIAVPQLAVTKAEVIAPIICVCIMEIMESIPWRKPHNKFTSKKLPCHLEPILSRNYVLMEVMSKLISLTVILSDL